MRNPRAPRAGMAILTIILLVLGGVYYAASDGRTQGSDIVVPQEFVGKVPEGAVRALFGPVKFNLIAERVTKASARPITYYQCMAVVGNVFPLAGGYMHKDEFLMTLSGWRASEHFLWEYSALTDVSSQIPSDREQWDRWASSVPRGSLYIFRNEEGFIYTGCALPPVDGRPARMLAKPSGAIERRVIDAIPPQELERKRLENSWVSKGAQIYYAYLAYLAEKRALPQNSAVLELVMGKEVAAAWTTDLRRYADEYFLPRANAIARKAGFQTPSAPDSASP